ncbi:MAG TPA: COX aromatic rich motif-containing protein [Candidatus Paceibacterota bacterium]|nr:COX aromatic rich motif-containing protein [Candidatus Paceibacterota bacterium]
MNRFWVFLLCVFTLLLAITTTVYVRSANIAILEPAGPVAAAEKDVIVTTALLCALVVVPVFGMLFVFAWKYRATNPDAHGEHHPTWDHYNWIAEVIWWIIPSAIIAILGVIAVQSSNALDPYKPLPTGEPVLTINVIALDWKWLFIYPEQGIASVNLVEFPENTSVHFYLTADAPMNSFWIPQLAGQIMVMPGMTTQLNLAASRTGDFNGFSGNISGQGFAGMAFTARAVSQSEFDEWVASVKASSTPLTYETYTALAQPSEYAPVTYYAPAADVFQPTVMKYMTPGSSMYSAMLEAMGSSAAPTATSTTP